MLHSKPFPRVAAKRVNPGLSYVTAARLNLTSLTSHLRQLAANQRITRSPLNGRAARGIAFRVSGRIKEHHVVLDRYEVHRPPIFSPDGFVCRVHQMPALAQEHCQVLDIVIGSVLALNREKHRRVRNAIVIEIAGD